MTCIVIFFNDTATTEIYTLSLHDALPIYIRAEVHDVWVPLGLAAYRRAREQRFMIHRSADRGGGRPRLAAAIGERERRSEEHTPELQSPQYFVCRLLLEKKTSQDWRRSKS